MFRLFIIDINRVMINTELSKNTVKSSECIKLYEQSQSQTHSQSQTQQQIDGHLNVRYLCSGVYYDTLSNTITSTTNTAQTSDTKISYDENSIKKDYKDKIFECSNFIKTLKNDVTYKKVINDIKMNRE